MENPTQTGASIHERLMEKLDPQELQEEVQEEVQEESQEEVKADAVEDANPTLEAEEAEEEAQEQAEDDTHEDGEQLTTLDLSQYFGLDDDVFDTSEDGEILVKTKIDGQEGTAKFNDLLASYQKQGHLDNQNREVKSLKQSLSEKQAELDSQYQEKIQQLENLSQVAYNELLTDYNSVNWDELRQDDPAEYSAKMTDYQTRQSRIAQLYQEAQTQKQSIQPSEEELQERVRQESVKLLDAFPKWSDRTTYQKERNEIDSYAVSLGFESDKVKSTIDHRMIVLLDKARQFDALQKESPKITKKVRKAPKIAKPGTTTKKVPTDVQKINELKSAIKKTGGSKSVVDYLMATGKA